MATLSRDGEAHVSDSSVLSHDAGSGTDIATTIPHGGTVVDPAASSAGQTFNAAFATISVVSPGQTVDIGSMGGGFLTIDNSGTAIFRVMAGGGMIGGGFISALNGGAADHWTMNGGIIEVSAGGLASHTVLQGGGILEV